MAETKTRERASVTKQRDDALLVAIRREVEASGKSPLMAAGALLGSLRGPSEEPSYEEEWAVNVLKAAIVPPAQREAAEESDKEDGEED